MSDKLFKNDLTPSVCQSDGNLGQPVACSAVLLTLPVRPSTTPWPTLLEKPPQRRNVLGKEVAG